MTPKQQALIEQLRDELNWTDDEIDDIAVEGCIRIHKPTDTWQELSVQDASELITELLRIKKLEE